jgi:hypothetical protein
MNLTELEEFFDSLQAFPGHAAIAGANAANRVAERVVLYADQTTRGWQHDVEFVAETDLEWGDMFALTFGTGDRIWNWLDKGTGLWGPRKAKYPIRPRRPGYPLRFRTGYVARTKPNSFQARLSGGGQATGPEARAMHVMHPGIKSRNWTPMLVDKTVEWFFERLPYELEREIKRALREATGIVGARNPNWWKEELRRRASRAQA